jgi:surface-anchored protein
MKRVVFLLLATVLSAPGYTVIVPDGQAQRHADLSIVYVSGRLEGRVRSDALGTFQPAEALLYDGPEGTTTINQPAGATWSFIGAGAGNPFYYWPQSDLSQRLYLGMAADGALLNPSAFASYYEADPRVDGVARWIRVMLLEVQFDPAPGELRPGRVSLWQTDGPTPTVWWSTFQGGITAQDSHWQIAGGHAHFNWGFTARGYYRATLQFSAFLNDGLMTPVVSDPVTYHFGVEYQPPALIPEPASLALLSAGLLIVARRRVFRTTLCQQRPQPPASC